VDGLHAEAGYHALASPNLVGSGEPLEMLISLETFPLGKYHIAIPSASHKAANTPPP